MKKSLFIILVSLITGFAAAIGTLVGGGVGGQSGLFVGGILFGVMGVSTSVRAACKLHLCNSTNAHRAFAGGVAGFLVAAPLAIAGSQLLHTPIIPIASVFLVGAGALLGAGRRSTRNADR